MWKFEVAFINENGMYQWRGFGRAEQLEKFLKSLVKKGLKIVDISDWDADGFGKKMKETYLA